MPVVFAGIAPHGDEIVPVLNPDMDEKCKRLMDAMYRFSKELIDKKPDSIVIATPHNLRIHKHMGVIVTSYLEGTWGTEHGSISIKAECDRNFAWSIYDRAIKENLPIVAVNYGVAEGEHSKMCLDWGTIIPLWFINKTYEEQKLKLPPIVVITPSREIIWDYLVKLGELIADVSATLGKRVAFIASADQAHTHDPKGPYGYSEKAKEFDDLINQFVRENQLEKLLELSPKLIEEAKPDSFWQLLILYGVLRKINLRLIFTVYECPTYFGMLVAAYS